jgi:hypothetical protein
LECLPGWLALGIAARHGRRQGRRFRSKAVMICWVTCWRISVWLGIVRPPMPAPYLCTDQLAGAVFLVGSGALEQRRG